MTLAHTYTTRELVFRLVRVTRGKDGPLRSYVGGIFASLGQVDRYVSKHPHGHYEREHWLVYDRYDLVRRAEWRTRTVRVWPPQAEPLTPAQLAEIKPVTEASIAAALERFDDPKEA